MYEVTCLRYADAPQSRLMFCVDKYTGQTDTFVELKTSLVIRGQQDSEKFEKYDLNFIILSQWPVNIRF